MNDLKTQAYSKIQEFIKESGYTYIVEDILEDYNKYWLEGYYTSYTLRNIAPTL